MSESVIDRADATDPVVTYEGECVCGRMMPPVRFDERDVVLSAAAVRRKWPRLDHRCACSRMTIVYANYLHYLAGDW